MKIHHYKVLLERLKTNNNQGMGQYNRRLEEKLDVPYLSVFVANVGENYFKCKNNNGEEYRFLLVGRAVNGWFSKVNQCDEYEKFDWIDSERGTNRFREGRDPEAYKEIINESPYKLATSKFWNYAKEIWSKLNKSNENICWKNKWYENIAWTNLYKVAPAFGGNPSADLKRAQLEECIMILEKEICDLKPTHILFMTGADWFEDFGENLGKDSTERKGMVSIERKKNDKVIEDRIVEETGTISYGASIAKYVVAKRPERIGQIEYTEKVSAAFGE